MANLLTTAGADRILTMDLHAPQVQGFFDIPVDPLLGEIIFCNYFREKITSDLVVVTPDIGGENRVRAYAKRLNAPIAVIDKRRPQPNEVEIMNVIGEVEGKNTLMIDDICDTAGTLTEGAKKLKERGAKSVNAACTHAILSGPAVARLRESVIDEIAVTDTVPIDASKQFDRLTILSVAELFAKAIMGIHNEKSITHLFD